MDELGKLKAKQINVDVGNVDKCQIDLEKLECGNQQLLSSSEMIYSCR